MMIVLDIPTSKRLFLLELLGHIDYVKLVGELPDEYDVQSLQKVLGTIGSTGLHIDEVPKVATIKPASPKS